MSRLSRCLSRRGLLTLLAAVLSISLGWRSSDAAANADDARTLIQSLGLQVLEILGDDELSDRGKFDRLVILLEGPIDLDLVARLILGRHWRSASDKQRTEYLDLFRAYALDNLASKLHLYQGEQFDITDAKVVSEDDSLVFTRILSKQGPPLKVDWRLRRRDDGDLVAIDVLVEGVSLIVSQRSEFGAVIERQGMDGLLTELRARVEREA